MLVGCSHRLVSRAQEKKKKRIPCEVKANNRVKCQILWLHSALKENALIKENNTPNKSEEMR